jgi:hypothetical protein
MKVGDPVFEALFRQAVIDKYDDEINSLPSNEELAKLYPFSPSFDLRMKRVIARYRRKDIFQKISKNMQRVAVILLIVSTVFFGMLLTNPEVRAAVGNVIVGWYEQFTSITFTRTEPNVENAERIGLNPEYVPDGYFMLTSENIVDMTFTLFSNEYGNQIRFIYRPGYAATNISIDNENHVIENHQMNGADAFIAIATDTDFDNGIVFVFENHVVEIWGTVHIDELMKMAESLTVIIFE